jgi:selenocysteine-specific elongation factor
MGDLVLTSGARASDYGGAMQSAYTIGVAGHVDHGKTTLVRALTGIDTDRKAEEKRRGLSIEAGVAELALPSGRRAALVDVPGHTDFLKNTIRGLNSVDMALLVVAADDGVMPQTREHLEILRFFKTAAGLAVLSKTDLVDGETLALAEIELGELLKDTFQTPCPILTFSHKRPELGVEILAHIDGALDEVTAKGKSAPLRLWIDQVRSIRGHGTVVSGTVTSGRVKVDDEVELLAAGVTARVRSLEAHASAVPKAVAGQRVGLNLHRLPLRAVRRGMCLAAPGTIGPTFLLNVKISALRSVYGGIKDRQKVKVYLGTAVANALVVLMRGGRLSPGETVLAQLRLTQPVAALPRDPFVVTPLNRNSVVAGGQILEIPHRKFRNANAATALPLLRALQHKDLDAYVQGVFDNTADRLVSAAQLAAKTGLPRLDFERRISAKVQKGEWIYVKGHGAIAKDRLEGFLNKFGTAVGTIFHQAPMKKHVMLAEVAERLGGRVDKALVRVAADLLCENGDLVRFEGGLRPAGYVPQLGAAEDAQVALVLDFMQAAGLTPISPQFFWRQQRPPYHKAKAIKLFNYLNIRDRLIRLNGNRFLSVAAMEEIKQRVSKAIQERGYVTIGDCKALFGYGRSAGAHVLDYLNQVGFTVRREDKHYLKADDDAPHP